MKLYTIIKKIILKILKSFLYFYTKSYPNNSLIKTLKNGYKFKTIVHVLKQANNLNNHIISKKSYIYITGLPKTGGAYLTRALRNSLSPYLQGDDVMMDESIPNFDYFDKYNEKRCIMEFNQITSWINNYYPSYSLIVKKNSSAALRPDILYNYYGNSLKHIIFTIRKPSENYRSWKYNSNVKLSSFKLYRNSHENFFSDAEKFIDFYIEYHSTFLKNLNEEIIKKIKIVHFGNQNKILKELTSMYPKVNPIKLEGIINRSKKINSHPYFDSSKCHKKIKNLEDRFLNFGFKVTLL